MTEKYEFIHYRTYSMLPGGAVTFHSPNKSFVNLDLKNFIELYFPKLFSRKPTPDTFIHYLLNDGWEFVGGNDSFKGPVAYFFRRKVPILSTTVNTNALNKALSGGSGKER